MDSNHRLWVMSPIRNHSSIPQVENVGFEPRPNIPNVVCYHYTTFSIFLFPFLLYKYYNKIFLKNQTIYHIKKTHKIQSDYLYHHLISVLVLLKYVVQNNLFRDTFYKSNELYFLSTYHHTDTTNCGKLHLQFSFFCGYALPASAYNMLYLFSLFILNHKL